MGDGRSLPDNASASSDDSVRPPPRLDPSRIKPGPGALPPDAFDPLRHDEWEQFWHTIDQHYHPVNEDHIRNLHAIPVNPYGGIRDHDLRLPWAVDHHLPGAKSEAKRKQKREEKKLSLSPKKTEEEKHASPFIVKAENTILNDGMTTASLCLDSQPLHSLQADHSAILSSMNSFPLTHRLVAAMLDECGTGTAPPPPVLARSSRVNSTGDECFWMGIGVEADIRVYQAALEDRVKLELSETGLLDISNDEPLQTVLRKEQWVLRDIKTMNCIRKGALYNRIVHTELRKQAIDREIKRHCDHVEMVYLSRMVRNLKKNKKSRSKYQKLLQRMFGHYKDDKDGTNDKTKKAFEMMSNGRLLTNGDEKPRGGIKKKRKKSDSKGPPNIALSNGMMFRPGAS